MTITIELEMDQADLMLLREAGVHLHQRLEERKTASSGEATVLLSGKEARRFEVLLWQVVEQAGPQLRGEA